MEVEDGQIVSLCSGFMGRRTLFEVKEMDACDRYRVQSAVKNGAHVSLLHTFNLAIFKSSVFKYVKDTCSN